jgi:hypothetical protein
MGQASGSATMQYRLLLLLSRTPARFPKTRLTKEGDLYSHQRVPVGVLREGLINFFLGGEKSGDCWKFSVRHFFSVPRPPSAIYVYFVESIFLIPHEPAQLETPTMSNILSENQTISRKSVDLVAISDSFMVICGLCQILHNRVALQTFYQN